VPTRCLRSSKCIREDDLLTASAHHLSRQMCTTALAVPLWTTMIIHLCALVSQIMVGVLLLNLVTGTLNASLNSSYDTYKSRGSRAWLRFDFGVGVLLVWKQLYFSRSVRVTRNA
jgi:hypothetical protein